MAEQALFLFVPIFVPILFLHRLWRQCIRHAFIFRRVLFEFRYLWNHYRRDCIRGFGEDNIRVSRRAGQYKSGHLALWSSSPTFHVLCRGPSCSPSCTDVFRAPPALNTISSLELSTSPRPVACSVAFGPSIMN